MGLCKECIKEVNTDKIGAGACYYICDECSIEDVIVYLDDKKAASIVRKNGSSGTIKNYLKSWEHGTDESLLLEVAEKLYELQIDFDEIRDNHLEKECIKKNSGRKG